MLKMINEKWTQTTSIIVCNEKETLWGANEGNNLFFCMCSV
jgi:hypothetical protein